MKKKLLMRFPYGGKSKQLLKIMKLTVLISFCFVFYVSASTYSQTTKLSIKLSNSTIKEVLNQIEEKSEFFFLYKIEELDESKKVNIKLKNASIQEVLDVVLKGQNLAYDVYDRQIIIRKASESQDSRINPGIQSMEIKGKVIDTSGGLLPGVTVVVKGTTIGTITDADGRYYLSNIPLDATLIFSFVGMKTQEIEILGKTQINVTMEEETIGIKEVVAIGYGSIKKSDLTGAVSSVKVDELPKAANTSVQHMLTGKVAGVQIQAADAQPGGALSVLIRGAASTGAGNEPLYIIDGFPVSSSSADMDYETGSRYSKGWRSPLNSINPNDIESIEVLKDASSTSIYGSRAANGVVLITTKSGKEGEPRINYGFKQSVQTLYKQWEMMNASENMNATNAYLKERWMVDNNIGVYGGVDPSNVTPWTPLYTDSEIAQAGEGTNWLDEVTRIGKIQEHNLSVSGATYKTKYLVSVNSFDQSGVVENNNFNRFSGRLNFEQKIRDWIKIGVKANGSRIIVNNPTMSTGRGLEYSGVIEAAVNFSPTLPIKDTNGDYTHIPNSAFFPNPVSLLEISSNSVQNRLLAQSYIEIEPISNLKIRTQFGFDRQEDITNLYMPKTTLYGASFKGKANISQSNKFDKLFNTTITYNKKITEGHNFTVLGGYEFQEFNWYGHALGNTNFPTDAFLYNNIGAGESTKPSVSSYKGIDQLASYFGRLNYNVKDKYLITLTMRADGSTKFGKGNKFGYFPSGAIAWRIINETFMENAEWISNLKLRLSAGQTGNSNISGAFAYYSFGANYLFGSTESAGTYLSSYENDELKWETTTEYNLGLDFGFFNNRISGSIEIYKKDVSDLLGSRQLKTYLVLDEVAANLGITNSRGYEISVSTVNLQGDLKWNSTFNISAFRDRWKERSPDVVMGSYESITDPLRVIWGYKTDGFVQLNEVIPHMPNAKPGMLKIQDINGYDANNNLTGQPDGIINDADKVKLANADPDFVFGFSNNFEYKNFDLNIHVYGMVGLMKWNPYLAKAANISDITRGWNYPVIAKDFWSSENQNAKYPNNNVINPTSGWDQLNYEKADFIKVKNITLGYNLPNNGFLGSYFRSTRFYLDIANAFLFTKYTGIDPEYHPIDPSQVAAKYPSQRTYTLGINLEF